MQSAAARSARSTIAAQKMPECPSPRAIALMTVSHNQMDPTAHSAPMPSEMDLVIVAEQLGGDLLERLAFAHVYAFTLCQSEGALPNMYQYLRTLHERS